MLAVMLCEPMGKAGTEEPVAPEWVAGVGHAVSMARR